MLERQAAHPQRREIDRKILLAQAAKIKELAELNNDGEFGPRTLRVLKEFQWGVHESARRVPGGGVKFDGKDGSMPVSREGSFGPATLLAIRELTKADSTMADVFVVLTEAPRDTSTAATGTFSQNP